MGVGGAERCGRTQDRVGSSAHRVQGEALPCTGAAQGGELPEHFNRTWASSSHGRLRVLLAALQNPEAPAVTCIPGGYSWWLLLFKPGVSQQAGFSFPCSSSSSLHLGCSWRHGPAGSEEAESALQLPSLALLFLSEMACAHGRGPAADCLSRSMLNTCPFRKIIWSVFSTAPDSCALAVSSVFQGCPAEL